MQVNYHVLLQEHLIVFRDDFISGYDDGFTLVSHSHDEL